MTAVTEEHVATLRAQLAGDSEEYERRWQGLDEESTRTGYSALVAAAFVEAVDRRFANKGTDADVIEFVGDVRTRSERVERQLDPRSAERMIRAVYTDEEIDDLDGRTKGATQMLLLAALVADEKFDDVGLDQFLAGARALADAWTS
jgi:hypothetical protein